MKKPVPKPDLELIFAHYGARVVGADRGGWRKAECPLNSHEDNNPSASVNTDECRWKCFSCDKGGDAIDLILENDSDLGWAGARKLAESFLGEGDGDVRGEPARSGLLPGAKGSKPGRRNWTPPWVGL